MPSYRIDADGRSDVQIEASRITRSRDEIRFERRIDGQWTVEQAFPTASVRRILQRFVEADGSVRWAAVGRGLLTAGPADTASRPDQLSWSTPT